MSITSIKNIQFASYLTVAIVGGYVGGKTYSVIADYRKLQQKIDRFEKARAKWQIRLQTQYKN